MVQVRFVFVLLIGILQEKRCLFYPVKVTCRVLKPTICEKFLYKQKGKVLSAALTNFFLSCFGKIVYSLMVLLCLSK